MARLQLAEAVGDYGRVRPLVDWAVQIDGGEAKFMLLDPEELFKAFEARRSIATAKLTDTSATKVTSPFVEEHLRSVRKGMADDFWSYGHEPNRHLLVRFLAQHHAEGLSARWLDPEELFHPSSLETSKI